MGLLYCGPEAKKSGTVRHDERNRKVNDRRRMHLQTEKDRTPKRFRNVFKILGQHATISEQREG